LATNTKQLTINAVINWIRETYEEREREEDEEELMDEDAQIRRIQVAS